MSLTPKIGDKAIHMIRGGFAVKNNTIEYKGYYGSVDYSAEDDILFGSVIGVRGLISYEGKSIDELKENFKEAVDSYLEM